MAGVLQVASHGFHSASANEAGEKKEGEAEDVCLEAPGHRNAVRALCVAQDDSLVLSMAAESVKLWNPRSKKCVRTIPSGYGLAGFFCPGGEHAVIGCKGGEIELFDLQHGECLSSERYFPSSASSAAAADQEEGSDKEVYALALNPAQTGFCAGGAARRVLFFDLVQTTHEVGGASKRELSVRVASATSTDEDDE